ncbi:MAG TPA: hypothetical protein VHI93_04310 [Candidatus Thermoplasmatota archaeon]|nr:hypothetical protein [Candidatus Thermoplasmatota archaeon]
MRGWGVVLFLLSSGALFLLFLDGIPFLLLPSLLVGGFGTLLSWRNPRRALVFAAFLAFAAAAVLTGIGFLEAFPADPAA